MPYKCRLIRKCLLGVTYNFTGVQPSVNIGIPHFLRLSISENIKHNGGILALGDLKIQHSKKPKPTPIPRHWCWEKSNIFPEATQPAEQGWQSRSPASTLTKCSFKHHNISTRTLWNTSLYELSSYVKFISAKPAKQDRNLFHQKWNACRKKAKTQLQAKKDRPGHIQ